MSYSVSRPYSKWYDCGSVLLFSHCWSEEDRAELAIERMEDELERIRAADMMAEHFVNSLWPTLLIAILPPSNGYSRWHIEKLQWMLRTGMLQLLQEFWREKV